MFFSSVTVAVPQTEATSAPEKPKPRPKKAKKLKIRELRALYNCTTCGYRTMNRDTLRKHICLKNVDFNLKSKVSLRLPMGYIQCPKCNFVTKIMEDLRVHLGTHIEGVRQRCTDCDVSKNCVDTVYKCPKCYYSTKNPSSLKVHMHIHSRGTPYKCTECSYCAKDLKELIKHYDAMKDLKCKCGYTTHVKQQMATHKRSHVGDKPFSCGVCQFSTGDRAGLQRHMKKHSGV